MKVIRLPGRPPSRPPPARRCVLDGTIFATLPCLEEDCTHWSAIETRCRYRMRETEIRRSAAQEEQPFTTPGNPAR